MSHGPIDPFGTLLVAAVYLSGAAFHCVTNYPMLFNLSFTMSVMAQ